MSNTKVEIVEAAHRAGFGSHEDLKRMTKSELLMLWGGSDE